MKQLSGGSEMGNTPDFQSGEGGSIPTLPLQRRKERELNK